MRTTGVPCTVIGSVSGEQGHGGTRAYLVLEHPWPWRDSSGCWWQLQNPSLGGISASEGASHHSNTHHVWSSILYQAFHIRILSSSLQ